MWILERVREGVEIGLGYMIKIQLKKISRNKQKYHLQRKTSQFDLIQIPDVCIAKANVERMKDRPQAGIKCEQKSSEKGLRSRIHSEDSELNTKEQADVQAGQRFRQTSSKTQILNNEVIRGIKNQTAVS